MTLKFGLSTSQSRPCLLRKWEVSWGWHNTKFVPNFSSVTDPLWELTRGDNPFQWGQRQQRAFEEVKSLITQAPTLGHYQRGVHTRLITEASPVGLGAVLEQQQPDG